LDRYDDQAETHSTGSSHEEHSESFDERLIERARLRAACSMPAAGESRIAGLEQMAFGHSSAVQR